MKKGLLTIVSCLVFSFIFAQKELPSVKLKNLDGKEIDLKTFVKSGKITVISFWATWCSPCKKEIDNINELLDDWKKKYNLDYIAISIDDARDVPKIKPFVNGKKWDFPVLLDVNGDCKRSLNFPTVPFMILIDKNKMVVFRHSTYVEGDELKLEEEIKKYNK